MTSASDSERAMDERAVRYREAARAARLPHSSSDEEAQPTAPGVGRRQLRRRSEPRPTSGPADGAASAPAAVRTTRASRLRAAASGHSSGQPPDTVQASLRT